MLLANTAGLLTAYLDGILQSAPLPQPVASELRLVSGMLLQISGFQVQALDRSLAGLIVTHRQLWLSQARVPDTDKSALLDAPISPGHTFGPAVEKILQCSHWKWGVSRQVVSILPSHAPVDETLVSARDTDDPHCTMLRPEASPSGFRGRRGARRGAPAQQCSRRQFQLLPRHPPKQLQQSP
ncbi:UNVERIFIED_CONTAM: hypothetical protein FKN15_077959 [Acipenser sinensis]